VQPARTRSAAFVAIMTADGAPAGLDAWWTWVLNGVRAAALAVRVTAPRHRSADDAVHRTAVGHRLDDEPRRGRGGGGIRRSGRALADTWPSVPDADRGWPVTIAVDELAVLALSWPPDRHRPSADQRKDTLHYLDKLAATISAGGPPPGTPPSLPGHPRTTAALAALAAAVGDLRSAADRGCAAVMGRRDRGPESRGQRKTA